MPVTLRAALLAALLVAAGCSGSSDTTDAGPQSTDAGVDGGHTCFDVDAGCTTQADCNAALNEGDDAVHVDTCNSAGRCEHQGGYTAGCFSDVTVANLDINLASGFGNPSAIKSFQIRAFYAEHVDGTPVVCSDVQGVADYADGGSPLDTDPTLNVEEVLSARPNCPSPPCAYSASASLVTGSSVVLTVFPYSNGPDTDGVHSTGIQLGSGGCVATTVAANGNINVTVSP